MFIAIVPAYNEASTVGAVVKSLLPHVDRVLVVDDGSTDQTSSFAKEAGAFVIRHGLNRGQGAALETGHVYARQIGAEYVLHFDADGQFSVDDIAPSLSALQEANADVLFGSRYKTRMAKARVPWTKRYILRPLAQIVDRLFGAVKLSDAHNGFRMFTKKALDTISISHDGMAHASEIPALVKKHGLLYIEVPVSVTYHEYGQRMVSGIVVVKDLLLGRFSR
ncbi:MAG: glycosyltransferase family 2 protein [Candidatus Magasanikbacteria bacterium CG10_big_fil_rev_8_21_14_0_10_42_10]|uniref:Glycosyltransferase family 2 protein n=2 Tax=Candidatus Magasanikiibacteriota TaxID=1752731 RepID=A0A2H0TVF7_9BACT|nr:MAG: glycosyltransferase family 2 protein [Candidatus Magasanikbacteria bacterium CG10_big_fil_rev_8_21_14_0_10_42_10]PIZ92943.1 MAG: glycosyltransferase family 2 protein [Candidatus Magasanikbacteria bacterium CG_4_10_14_0_2_um_filter_41_10]